MVSLSKPANCHNTPPCSTGVKMPNECSTASVGRLLPRPLHWTELYPNRREDPQQPSLNLGIHWLRGLIPHAELKAITEWLSLRWGPDDMMRPGLWGYTRRRRWSNGATLNYNADPGQNDRMNGLACLEIPGGVIAEMNLVDFAYFCKELAQNFTWRCARIDAFADDLERVITPRELFELVYHEDRHAAPTIISRGPKKVLHRPVLRRDFTSFRVIGFSTECSASDGCQYEQVRFGRRGDKQGKGLSLSVYDKWLESGGEISAVRWEAEVTGERANNLFSRLVDTLTLEWGQVIATVIATCIDFPIRGDTLGKSNVHVPRLQRHAFWENLAGRLGSPDKNVLALAVKPKTVEKALGHVKRSMGTAQMLSVALGRKKYLKWYVGEVDKGDRLNQQHHNAIEAFQRHLAECPNDPGILEVMDWFNDRGFEFDPDVASEVGENGVSELQEEGQAERGGPSL